MGWPPEELTKALKRLVDAIGKTWKVLSADYSTPEKIEGAQKMYSAFVEFTAEVNDVRELFSFVMTYAPTVVEILEPPEFVLRADQLQDVIADLTAKLQELDKQVKMLSAENIALKKRIQPEKPKNEENVKKVVLDENSEESS